MLKLFIVVDFTILITYIGVTIINHTNRVCIVDSTAGLQDTDEMF
jgi:hypothetical protein